MGAALKLRASLCALLALGFALPASCAIVTRIPGNARVIALTFDACEGPKRATLDTGIVDYLAQERLPFTVFMGGRFARDNAAAVKAFVNYGLTTGQSVAPELGYIALPDSVVKKVQAALETVK